jgi:hypothetical protein
MTDATPRARELLRQQLPDLPLATVTDDRLVTEIRRFISDRDILQIVVGRLIAELHARGQSYRDIAEATGLPKTTADRWAQPFKAVAQ